MMKSQLEFCSSLLSNVLLDSDPYVSKRFIKRDLGYAEARAVHEGLSFYTKTLPSFGKHLLQCIEKGHFSPFQSFKTRRGRLLPEFLSGWTKCVFEADGSLRPDPDPYALQELLQICMLFYKLELPSDRSAEAATISSFIKTEEEVKLFEKVDCFSSDSVIVLARELVHRVLDGFDPKRIHPKHGSGSVATGERFCGKWDFKRKYTHLHSEFPYYEYFSPSLSRAAFESGWYKRLQVANEAIAKVALVPKDSRGPRLISMEPLEIQFIQQGVHRALVPHLERHPLTKGSINFTDQSFNRAAALESSKTRELATLDLKDASDRISLALVRHLLPEGVYRAFVACRSAATTLPDGSVVRLSKFAPMGSALCFPMLALTVWAIATAAISVRGFKDRRILIFGDDLIVPTEAYGVVCESLETAGLVVNKDKSFRNSHFRESCGMDAFHGVQVTPIRCKRTIMDKGRLAPSATVSFIAMSDAFFDKGYWKTCAFLREFISSTRRVPWLPIRGNFGYFCPDVWTCIRRNRRFKHRWNRRYQQLEVYAPYTTPTRRSSRLSESGRFLAGLLGRPVEGASQDHSGDSEARVDTRMVSIHVGYRPYVHAEVKA